MTDEQIRQHYEERVGCNDEPETTWTCLTCFTEFEIAEFPVTRNPKTQEPTCQECLDALTED